jgi:purine-nucleoside phosphorylase
MRWLWAPPQYLTDQDWMIVPIGEHRVLVLVSRVYAYQGHDLRHVVHPVRAAGVAGARIVVLTNAAGGLRPDLAIGQPMLISDHLNLTARSPLLGAQFLDLTDAYAPRLRQLARPELTRYFAGM